MNISKLHIFTTVRMSFFLCVLLVCTSLEAKNSRFQEFQQQDTIVSPSIQTLWKTASALNNTKKYDSLLHYLATHIHKVTPKTAKDSLDVADLYFYQCEGNYYTQNYLESIKSIDKGLPYCATILSDRGIHIKGVLYYKKAYRESSLNFEKRAKNSMKTAIDYLATEYEKSLDYLVDAYVFLSSQAAYHGNLAEAKMYIRLAENVYKKNRQFLDNAREDRYEVVLAYRKAYLLYKLAKKKEDSLELTKVVKKLDELQALPTFNKQERIYYSTAMNHVGDWYISHKADSLTTEEDVKLGNYYLDKSINLIENKNYPGDPLVFKYNKCKALTKANELQKANALIVDLLRIMSPTDRRKPFFLAQKALIKAKMYQKDSALHLFHTVIENIHSDTTTLAKDYSNFKPSKLYGEARLIRRVAEKLSLFYNDDVSVRKTIAKLYHLAFIQFENSYVKTKFNPAQNNLLREILYGVLVTKKEEKDTENITIKELLGRTETIMNQMTWQRFYQNRYTNNLPALDSLQNRHLQLRSLLAIAKRDDDVRQKDSLQELINKHATVTNKKFPNLALLSTTEFEISTLQENLHEDELVLKYIIFDTQIATFSITKDNVTWKLQPWTTNEIDHTEKLINSIINRNFDTEIAAFLSAKLLPKIDENIQKIIINPDGELYNIPFEILQIGDQFLTENYQIRYTSNLKFIHVENHQKPKTHGIVAIYAPTYPITAIENATRNTNSFLKGAKEEAAIISKLFPSKTYTGENISKQYFIETAPKAGILHLAMHAEIDTNEPGLSRLIFNKNNPNTNDLYLEELYALSLNADLVVLSACNTGLGKENAGRNLESFQRAFTFSGVPATVVSLWEVPDQSTSEIMESFYTYLKAGNTKSNALQNAKIAYLKKHKGTKLEQPYYWTGFVLYGDESPIAVASLNMLFIGCVLLAVIVLLLFFRKTVKYHWHKLF